jgi:hypothetical protein
MGERARGEGRDRNGGVQGVEEDVGMVFAHGERP